MFYLHLVGNWCTTLYLDDRMACFFLLRRKLCIVSQVWGYYSRLPNEWVMGTNRCCFLFLIDANETQNFITKSNHSASTKVLLPSFTAQATGFFTRKFCTTEAEHKNYDHKDTSLHVSLRTRNFDRKIHYCCKDSFFVKKDI